MKYIVFNFDVFHNGIHHPTVVDEGQSKELLTDVILRHRSKCRSRGELVCAHTFNTELPPTIDELRAQAQDFVINAVNTYIIEHSEKEVNNEKEDTE